MAQTAAHVVMLQRSPSYMASRPAEDPFAKKLQRKLPARLAYGVIRWRNLLLQQWLYRLARRKPEVQLDDEAGLDNRGVLLVHRIGKVVQVGLLVLVDAAWISVVA